MAKENTKTALDAGIDPLEAVDQGLSKGMEIVGAKFEREEFFLPELLMAVDTFNVAMEIINPAIEAKKQKVSKKGTVLLATVKGDLHNIVDIGIDQSTINIIEEAEKNKADIIGLSSVMTTTMPNQKELIDVLEEMKIRDKYFVLVGGGPVTQKWADEIGADGYGDTAVDAVNISKELLNGRK